jgi:hypothetical protein
MVAVKRPNLIAETMAYLVDNVLQDFPEHEYRFIVNIDPVGDRKHKQKDVVELLEKTTSLDKLIVNCPKKPGVVKAVKWTLNTSCKGNPDYIFFKEDDIAILEKLDLNEMIRILEKYPKLSSLHTDKWGTKPDHVRTVNENTINRCGMHWKWNGDFYKAPSWKKAYSFLPSLTKAEFLCKGKQYIKTAVGESPTNIMKGKSGNVDGTLFSFLQSWDYGYFTKYNKPRQITDLGKEWKAKRGWKKPPRGVWQTWVK